MTAKKNSKETPPSTVVANDPDDLKGTLKNIGGSRSDHWNNILANQTISNTVPPSPRWSGSGRRTSWKA
jgi:hypothetical protein